MNIFSNVTVFSYLSYFLIGEYSLPVVQEVAQHLEGALHYKGTRVRDIS